MERLTIKDLAMFIGCLVEITYAKYKAIRTLDFSIIQYSLGYRPIKLILRPLSDMTEDEFKEVCNILDFGANEFYKQSDRWWARKQITKERLSFKFDLSDFYSIHVWEEFTPDFKKICFPLRLELEVIKYLISKQFDVFGWIDKGLAINKTKL